MLDIIGDALARTGIPYRVITGDTPLPQRARLVADFEASRAPEVFLLSLKAAGTGLTLTKADYVFLFDPWWNPAVERQAIDRTHRIGQTRPVFAYRMVTVDSIEERVMRLVHAKQELFDAVIGESAVEGEPKLDRNTLLSLLD